jgi:hypothetical protein
MLANATIGVVAGGIVLAGVNAIRKLRRPRPA